MFTGNSDAAWERYGKLDPNYGVWNEDKYKTKDLSESTLEEFFRSGENIDSLLRIVSEDLTSNLRPTIPGLEGF